MLPERTGGTGTLHVVSFEEAGDCTLRRVALAARPGDSVLLLGPERLAHALRDLGLSPEVAVRTQGRVGARWFGSLRATPTAAAAARDAVAYGPRAARAVGLESWAQVPENLPDAPSWTMERRARIRRELGLAPRDFAVLVAGDPAGWIDLSFPIRALSMAFVAGAPVRPVVSPQTPRLAKLNEYFEVAARGRPIVIDARAERPWELLPALDALLADTDGARTQPVECAGWRRPSGAQGVEPEAISPLPALWALACGTTAFVHRDIALGSHADHPLVVRYADDIAQLAREIHARASSASAASR